MVCWPSARYVGAKTEAGLRQRLALCLRRALSRNATLSACGKASAPQHAELDTVIRLAPLIAIDLIIRNAREEVLLGLRKNEPAKGCYFVPGGMILKNERLAEAFARLAKNETDHAASFGDARLIGVFEHFYDNNVGGPWPSYCPRTACMKMPRFISATLCFDDDLGRGPA